MKIIDVVQGTPEWHAARRCKVTGTKLKRVMGTLEARTGLIAELIAEEASEQTKTIKVSAQMERGTEEEAFAIKAFEQRTGKKVDRIGMAISDEFDWLALSPDGLIHTDGEYTEAIEVKCPDTDNAILYKIENMIDPVLTGLAKWSKPTKAEPTSELYYLSGAPFCGIPAEYKWQAVNYFLVNEKLQTLHFAIYDARIISDDAKLYVMTISHDDQRLQEAMTEAREVLVAFRKDWIEWRDIVLPIAI
jgi:hypothetical protein